MIYKVVIYAVIICTIKAESMFKCRTYEENNDSWLTKEGLLYIASNSNISDFAFSPCGQNISEGFESAGMCLLCSSISHIVACVGSNVTQLPDPKELPSIVDIYQVRSSDVRILQSAAFFNKTIKEIYIEHNDMKHISQNTFEGVIGLKTLSLANNNLPYFLIVTVEKLYSLETLILDDNNLEYAYSGDLTQTSSRGMIEVIAMLQRRTQEKLSLKTLSLNNNPLKYLPKAAFTWLSNSRIEFLSMRSCSIESSHPEALKSIKKTLLELELSDVTNIASALPNITAGLRRGRLLHLGLSASGLVSIPRDALTNIADTLQGLALQGNTFQNLRQDAFPEMPNLLTLDLRRSSIMILEDGVFNGLSSLSTLYLSGNRFTVIHKPFYQLQNLRFLDLSQNPESILTEPGDEFQIQENTFEGLENLTTLFLYDSKIQKIYNNYFSPLKSLSYLSLCNTEIKMTRNRMFQKLSNLRILDLSGSTQLVSRLKDPTLLRGLKKLIELDITNSKFEFQKDVDIFQELEHLQTLNLENSAVRYIYPNSFRSLKSIHSINFNGNHLSSWSEPVFYNNTNLSQISMNNNQLSYITDAMLQEMSFFDNIAMDGNPLQCDCNMELFVLEIANSSNTEVENWNKRFNPITCYDPISETNLKLIDVPKHNFCEKNSNIQIPDIVKPTSEITIIAIACSVSFFVFSLIGVVVYRKRNNLRYFALMVKNAMAVALLEDDDETGDNTNFLYDVFVSYCDADRDWVIQEMLPSLEGDAQLRVCLHERDFQPGHGILDNIIHCIDKSKTLLFVVSKKSLKSQWCQFEMHLAQHRLVETKRDRLILVLMGEIPSKQRPRTLHYLMATRTYLIWSQQQSKVFWKRLKKALLFDLQKNESYV